MSDSIIIVKWISPRGFANDGFFAYGTAEEWMAYFDRTGMLENPHSVVTTISTHRSVDVAARHAMREAIRSNALHLRRGEVARCGHLAIGGAE